MPPALPSLPASPKAKQPVPVLVKADSPEPAADLETPDVDPEPALGRKVRALERAAWGGSRCLSTGPQGGCWHLWT